MFTFLTSEISGKLVFDHVVSIMIVYIVQQSQSGMISGKVSENHVKMILEQLSDEAAKKKKTVTIDRKKYVDDPTEPDLDDLWSDED